MENASAEGIKKKFLPVLISNWVLGVGIIEHPLGNKYLKLSFAYSLFHMIFSGYIGCKLFFSSSLKELNVTNVVTIFTTNTMLAFSAPVLGLLQTKNLPNCFSKAALADNTMKKLRISKSLPKELLAQIIYFVGIYTVRLILLTINITLHVQNKIDLSIITMFYPFIVTTVMDLQFISILEYGYLRFNQLNNVLRSLLTSDSKNSLHARISKIVFQQKNEISESPQMQSDHRDYTFIIKTAKLAHQELVGFCQETYNTHGFYMLITIIFCIISIICHVYHVYDHFMTHGMHDIFLEHTTNITIALSLLLRLFAISYLSSAINQTALESGDLISELYDEPFVNENTKTEIRLFNTELAQDKLDLSACGIMRIDLGLVSMVISAVVTCMIIIIQF